MVGQETVRPLVIHPSCWSGTTLGWTRRTCLTYNRRGLKGSPEVLEDLGVPSDARRGLCSQKEDDGGPRTDRRWGPWSEGVSERVGDPREICRVGSESTDHSSHGVGPSAFCQYVWETGGDQEQEVPVPFCVRVGVEVGGRGYQWTVAIPARSEPSDVCTAEV